jgi:hypothetical protein
MDTIQNQFVGVEAFLTLFHRDEVAFAGFQNFLGL